MRNTYFVYITTNKSGTLYIGVTNSLERRMLEHKQAQNEGFTERYNCYRLVYFECHHDVNDAIRREKQLKKWRRDKKVRLIDQSNPEWEDLSEGWYEEL